jgi:hypothetical protein
MLLVRKFEMRFFWSDNILNKKFVYIPTVELCENLSLMNCGGYDKQPFNERNTEIWEKSLHSINESTPT